MVKKLTNQTKVNQPLVSQNVTQLKFPKLLVLNQLISGLS